MHPIKSSPDLHVHCQAWVTLSKTSLFTVSSQILGFDAFIDLLVAGAGVLSLYYATPHKLSHRLGRRSLHRFRMREPDETVGDL